MAGPNPVVSTLYMPFYDDFVANNSVPVTTGVVAPDRTAAATTICDQILLQQTGGLVGGVVVAARPVDIWCFQNVRHPGAVAIFKTKLTPTFPYVYFPSHNVGGVDYFPGVAVFSKIPISGTSINSPLASGFNKLPRLYCQVDYPAGFGSSPFGLMVIDTLSASIQPPSRAYTNGYPGTVNAAVANFIDPIILARADPYFFYLVALSTGNNKREAQDRYDMQAASIYLTNASNIFTDVNYPGTVGVPILDDGWILTNSNYSGKWLGVTARVNTSIGYTTNQVVGRLPTIWG